MNKDIFFWAEGRNTSSYLFFFLLSSVFCLLSSVICLLSSVFCLAPYPAVALPELSIRDHYSLILPIPFDVVTESFETRRLKTNTLTDEDWEGYDVQLRELLGNAEHFLKRTEREKDLDGFHAKLGSILRGVRSTHFVTQKEPIREGPIDLFIRQHSGHHLIPDLRHAMIP